MVTYDINLDLVKDTYTNFKCKQNDDIVLKFNIYNNSVIENLTGSTVILNALRNNNTFVKQTNNIVIDKNIITINCLRDITRVGGKLKLELVIIKDNKQTTTFNIDATVVNSVITDNAEASKNVVSVIEELDNKIAQGKEIVAEVDRKKTEAIDTVNKLKNDTITSVTELKNTTITQLNNTKKEVETLKQQTIEESTKIKDSAIGELSKIKTDSITELTKIKESSITELNSIKDTANTDLNKIKKDTIDTVNTAVNNAIAEINKYNIKEVNDKIDNHIADDNAHVTKELKNSITKNSTDLDAVKKDLNNNILAPFTTDKPTTKLDNSKNGFITDLNIKGKTLVQNNTIKSVGEDENNKIEILTTKNNGTTGDKLSIQLSEPLHSLNDVCDEIKGNTLYRRIKEVVVDSSLNLQIDNSQSKVNFKKIWFNLDNFTNVFNLYKFDGKLLEKYNGQQNHGDVVFYTSKLIEIWINNLDSGWGDNYMPSVDEVKAYFYGWRMSTTDGSLYNGVGGKCWTPFSRVGMNTDSQLTMPTSYSKYPFTPYKLYYQLANPTTESLNKTLILSTFKDCSLQLNNSVMPIVSGKYPTNLGGGLESVVSSVKDINDAYGVPSNPNLLINGDFQVWQRGNKFTSFMQQVAYSADRWSGADNTTGFYIEKSENGLSIKKDSDSEESQRFRFHQLLDNPKKFNGKTLTLSMKTTSSIVRKIGISAHNNLTPTIPIFTKVVDVKDDITTVTFSIPNNTFDDSNVFAIGFAVCCGNSFPYYGFNENYKFPSGSLNIEWIKLELGGKATPFIPRLYGEELMLCQRYYFPLKSQQWLTFIGVLGGSVKTDFYLPTKMRIEPTLADTNPLPEVYLESGWVRATKVDSANCIENKISIAIESTSLTYSDSKAHLVRNLPNLDAEIY